MGTAFTSFCTFHVLRADFNNFYEGLNVVRCVALFARNVIISVSPLLLNLVLPDTGPYGPVLFHVLARNDFVVDNYNVAFLGLAFFTLYACGADCCIFPACYGLALGFCQHTIEKIRAPIKAVKIRCVA